MITLVQIQEMVRHLMHLLTNASPLAYSSAGVGVIITVLYFKIVSKDVKQTLSFDGDGSPDHAPSKKQRKLRL